MREAIKKYGVLWGIEIIILLFLLIGCFQKEQLVYSAEKITLDSETITFKGNAFSVKPGVYQIRVHISNTEQGQVYILPGTEKASFRALRGNGVFLLKGHDYIDFEMYVMENIDKVFIECNGAGEQVMVDLLEVYWVNWGYRIIACLILIFSLILNFMIVFREKILSCAISKEKQVVVWTLSSCVLFSFFPYMTDYFSYAADMGFHWLRIEHLKESLLLGNQFPIRVQSGWLFDHGYAVSAFNGDLFFLFPAMLRIIGFSLMTTYKTFIFVIMAVTAIVTYYSLIKCVKQEYAALFGTVIYMLAPYRLYNFYNRAAIEECLAMCFLPLVVCGMYRLFTENVNCEDYKYAKIPLIVGLSCVLQSHVLSYEMAVLSIVGVCVIAYKKTFRKETFIQLVQAAAICLLLNMWFWLPLLQMMFSDQYQLGDNIVREIQYRGTWFAGLFQLYPNKGDVQDGMYNAEPFQMGVASFIMLIVGLGISIYQWVKKQKYDKKLVFWGSIIIICWIMSTRYFPWDVLAKVPVISTFVTSIQFPTRLFVLVTLFMTFYAGFFFLWLIENKEILEPVKRATKSGLLLLAFGSAIYHVNHITYHSEPIWLYTAENMGTASVMMGEYLLENTSPTEYYYHKPVAQEGLMWSDYEKEGTDIRIYVENITAENLLIELPLIGYKGYEVNSEKEDGKKPFVADERGTHGDLIVVVPANYKGYIEVGYKGFISFRIAEVISALTLVGIVIFGVKRRMQWKAKMQISSEE